MFVPTRAPDFRYFFANTIGFTMSDNEIKIVFGVQEAPGDLESSLEQAGVLLTLKTAKVLSNILAQSLEHYEKTTGTTIPYDDAKSIEFKAMLDDLNPSEREQLS
jgi:hypothetical protein